ncbi:MAG: shikimate dehydrogenase [Chloroflexia bacterium]|nr:shikimate dehydrogenase [Chloroflexia bacterium]
MLVSGLIGDPVDHSLSAFMHNAAFEALGIDARYELWATRTEELPARLHSLRTRNVLGANVTVPHKRAVMPLLDDVSDAARRIGAVNTLIPRADLLLGENTDAYGFGRSLLELTEGAIPASALVVGAGGASRAVLVSLQDAGVADIRIVNRTPATARSLAAALNGPDRPSIVAAPWSQLTDLAPATQLIVNATSIGWHDDDLPFEAGIVNLLPPEAVVMDLTYRQTSMLRLASDRALRSVDGLPMLIYQGARAFRLWTGQDAPIDAMSNAVRAAYASRS